MMDIVKEIRELVEKAYNSVSKVKISDVYVRDNGLYVGYVMEEDGYLVFVSRDGRVKIKKVNINDSKNDDVITLEWEPDKDYFVIQTPEGRKTYSGVELFNDLMRVYTNSLSKVFELVDIIVNNNGKFPEEEWILVYPIFMFPLHIYYISGFVSDYPNIFPEYKRFIDKSAFDIVVSEYGVPGNYANFVGSKLLVGFTPITEEDGSVYSMYSIGDGERTFDLVINNNDTTDVLLRVSTIESSTLYNVRMNNPITNSLMFAITYAGIISINLINTFSSKYDVPKPILSTVFTPLYMMVPMIFDDVFDDSTKLIKL